MKIIPLLNISRSSALRPFMSVVAGESIFVEPYLFAEMQAAHTGLTLTVRTFGVGNTGKVSLWRNNALIEV